MFICFICGMDSCYYERSYTDMVGNEIYICKKCMDERMHRIKYRYRFPVVQIKAEKKLRRKNEL